MTAYIFGTDRVAEPHVRRPSLLVRSSGVGRPVVSYGWPPDV